jgi:RNA polymerase sigma-70 factor (ECF subfamily)
MARGEQDALASLYGRHGAALTAYLASLVRDPDLAEEVVQDALLAAWRGAGRFRGDSAVRTWLFAIARRQAVGRRRRGMVLDTVADDEVLAQQASDLPGPEAVVLARAELGAVQAAVLRLSPAHREVLHLVFVECLSLQECALVTGVPVGTIKSRLSYARRALTQILARSEEG